MRGILAIDAGNTRVKWGLFDVSGTMLESGACLNADIAQAKLPDATRIVISNVAGEHIKKQLKSLLPKGTSTHWVIAKAKNCGVSNCYENPEKLGTDRWSALIAAWHIKQAPCIVVNAGTAVTIDALNLNHGHGEFIGGMILPGIHLMQHSLGMATAQLPSIPSKKSTLTVINQYQDIFANNTTDAMRAGALNAVCGAVMQISLALEDQCKQVPHIVISGGDAQQIKDNLGDDVTKLALIVDNLVLLGLYLIEDFMLKEHTKSEQQ